MDLAAVVEAERSERPASHSRLPSFFRPLADRDFRLLWVGQSVSLIGDQFYMIALAWLTLQLTGSALALGGVLTAAAIPRAILMLAGGAITDRFSPRKLMLLSDGVRAVLVGVQAALILSGHVQLWQIYILAALFGTIDAVFYPSAGAIIPMLVDEEKLPAANALQEVSTRGTVFIGPALAGVLIALAGRSTGIGAAFAVDALSFVVSAIALAFMRGGSRPRRHETEVSEQASGLFASIFEGLRYAWHDPMLRPLLIIIAGIDVTLNGTFGVGLPLLVRSHFSAGAATLGVLLSAFGAGAVIGIVIAGSIRRPRRRGLLVIGVTAGFGVGTLFLPFMPSVPMATVWIAGMAIGSGLINVVMGPWLQTRTDPSMMGRVMSMIMFASVGLTPLAFAAAGWLASVSLTLLFVLGGSIVLTTALFGALNRPIRTFD